MRRSTGAADARTGLRIVVALVLMAGVAIAALRAVGFVLAPPHHARTSAAVLDAAMRREVDDLFASRAPTSVDAVASASSSITDRALHFGLRHRTSLSFSPAEREGNCIEYAHLFAKVFDLGAARASLDAHAYAVHSDHARVFGETLPFRGWSDHDWVLIEDRTGAKPRRLFVDPTLHDFGLGWDVSRNVQGAVVVP